MDEQEYPGDNSCFSELIEFLIDFFEIKFGVVN
jgi:hypothetical protein